MIPLQGNWLAGLAFDLHTTESVHLGVDENGKDRFENKYTEMGELVHRLKYKNDQKALADILNLLDRINWRTKVDFIIPIPPTDQTRSFQPVAEIANGLGLRLGIPVLTQTLIKTSGGKQLKAIADPEERELTLRDSMKVQDTPLLQGKSVLLVDDLYRSGATLRIATDLLMKVAKVRVVSVLTMTRTRSHR